MKDVMWLGVHIFKQGCFPKLKHPGLWIERFKVMLYSFITKKASYTSHEQIGNVYSHTQVAGNITTVSNNKKHLKNVGPPPFAIASRFTLSFTRCRYCRHCRTPPAHRCPRWQQRMTEETAMAPWNGPNKDTKSQRIHEQAPRSLDQDPTAWSSCFDKFSV